MEGKKPLCLTDGFESTYLPFLLARRLMRSLHAIIGVTLGRVSHVAEAGSDRGRVDSQSVSDDAQWLSSLPASEVCGRTALQRFDHAAAAPGCQLRRRLDRSRARDTASG